MIKSRSISQQESNLLKFAEQKDTVSRVIISEFSKNIHDNRFHTNLDRLLDNSDIIKFDLNKWMRRPDMFCKDYYDLPTCYHIVLLVNNISSYFSFVDENLIDSYIIAPRFEVIKSISIEILNSASI